MAYLSQGDLVCVEGDAEFGRTAVNTMMTTYHRISTRGASWNDPQAIAAAFSDAKLADFRAKFSASVDAVKASFDKLGDPWPFSTKKCAMRELGKKAEELTTAMLKYVGVYAPAPMKYESPLDQLGKGLGNMLFYGALIVGGLVLLPHLKKPTRQNPRRRRR